MKENVVLEINDLCYAYPKGGVALEHVSFSIQENEFVAIIGQNGAGKSTLLKNITGLLRPSSGYIKINGRDNRNMSVAEISKEIGFVLQNPDRQLFADTVYKELEYGLINHGIPEDERKARIAETLEQVGLVGMEEEFPPALSKGDRAKVVIGCVVAMRPNIIILDEPTSGQDYIGCYQIMNIAKRMHEEGHTVIFVTHHMPLVTEFAERTIVMAKKQVMMDDLAHSVFARTEELATTNIKPPQITQFASYLEETIPLGNTMLSVKELGDRLLELQHDGNA